MAAILADRAAHAGIAIPDSLAHRLLSYFQLLSHWNRTINLTALSDTDEAVDRLLVEPVVAAAHLAPCAELIDLGSGGGSPAIPLALALRVDRVVMVEARARKAAFLREALREVSVPGSVETGRFEDLAGGAAFRGAFGLVSVRAVRLDEKLFRAAAAFLKTGGRVAMFRSTDAVSPLASPGLRRLADYPLIPASRSVLTVLEKS